MLKCVRGVRQNHNIQPYMANLAAQHTGGPSSHPSLTPLLSAFTRSLKCCVDSGMSCTTEQINTDHVIRLARSVFELHPALLPSMPSVRLAFISSCAWTRYHYMSCSLVASSISTDDTKDVSLKVDYNPIFSSGIMSYLYLRREPADLHQFSVTDTSNSRRPRDCLYRHLNTALVLPPPSITASGF